VACNTASVASLAHLRASFAIPFVGMVPAVKPAAAASRARKVGVMATNATFQGDMFDELVQRFAADVAVVRQVCPGLVQAVEQGELDTPATRALLRSYVQPLIEAQVDTVVLGCTHYVFLRPLVEEMVGSEIAVIDSGLAVARQVARVLRDNGLDNDAGNGGAAHYYTTGDDSEVARVVVTLTPDVSPIVKSVVLASREVQPTAED
jgi:glutamate racemase